MARWHSKLAFQAQVRRGHRDGPEQGMEAYWAAQAPAAERGARHPRGGRREAAFGLGAYCACASSFVFAWARSPLLCRTKILIKLLLSTFLVT